MDKQAYHLNKKKQPAKTEGKFLYYYPCADKSMADVCVGKKWYVVVEVTEAEWEALIELDRLEYNNEHAALRHKADALSEDEDSLKPSQQEKQIDRDTPFSLIVDAKIDREKLKQYLTPMEQEIVEICIDRDESQTTAAKWLNVSQGYISAALRRIEDKIFELEFENADPDEVVWTCWNMFVARGEMPMFIDVEIEHVLRSLMPDLLILLHSYGNLGDLCRHVLRYYLFENEGPELQRDVDLYKQLLDEGRLQHFEDYYGDQLLIIQAVFARLCLEVKRRNEMGVEVKDRVYDDLLGSLYKIAYKLKMDPWDFLEQRFYPSLAKWRYRRERQFYKAYTGKSLPKK